MSELKFHNFAFWYQEALKMLYSNGLEPFSYQESLVAGHIIGCYDRDFKTDIGDRLLAEIDDFHIPKYVCLVMWLSPLGLASHAPNLTVRLAKYLLGETREIEENLLPSKLKDELNTTA